VMPPRDPRLDQARDAIRDGLVATLANHGKPAAPPSSGASPRMGG